jgi:hypothetical protein
MQKNRVIPAAQRAACEAITARADQRAAKLAPLIAELRAAGMTSKKGIAKALNKRAIRTRAASASGARYRLRAC